MYSIRVATGQVNVWDNQINFNTKMNVKKSAISNFRKSGIIPMKIDQHRKSGKSQGFLVPTS